MEKLNDKYWITTDKNKVDIEEVYNLLSKSYWANSRSRDMIIKTVNNSLCFSLYDGNKQIGFSRVVTDYIAFAYLCDVIINEDYRGKGLGKLLLDSIVNCEELKDIKRFSLATKDAHEFYKCFGFKALSNPEKYMERIKE